MEASYRRSASVKQKAKHTAEDGKADRRRLVQLLASLLLFLLVFIGRGVFPVQAEQWDERISEDTNFGEFLRRLEQEIASGESIGTALRDIALGPDDSDPQPELTDNEVPVPETIELLSESDLHGFSYLKKNGFAVYRDLMLPKAVKDEPAEVVEPKIVTAVAQTHNSMGEKLPSNVSYEYYELGLEQTVIPVSGTVTSGFEYRNSPISGKREFHLALDIAAAEGTEIKAFSDGVVRYIGESDDFGLYLMIDHDNGVATFYAHCSKLLVHKGDSVACGETVALVGHTGNATGSHLHFTLLKDNIRLDPSHYVRLP